MYIWSFKRAKIFARLPSGFSNHKVWDVSFHWKKSYILKQNSFLREKMNIEEKIDVRRDYGPSAAANAKEIHMRPKFEWMNCHCNYFDNVFIINFNQKSCFFFKLKKKTIPRIAHYLTKNPWHWATSSSESLKVSKVQESLLIGSKKISKAHRIQ